MSNQELRAQVRAELNDHLRHFVEHANDYIEHYVDTSSRGRRPYPRRDTVHPYLRKFVQDIALDAAMGHRRG